MTTRYYVSYICCPTYPTLTKLDNNRVVLNLYYFCRAQRGECGCLLIKYKR